MASFFRRLSNAANPKSYEPVVTPPQQTLEDLEYSRTNTPTTRSTTPVEACFALSAPSPALSRLFPEPSSSITATLENLPINVFPDSPPSLPAPPPAPVLSPLPSSTETARAREEDSCPTLECQVERDLRLSVQKLLDHPPPPPPPPLSEAPPRVITPPSSSSSLHSKLLLSALTEKEDSPSFTQAAISSHPLASRTSSLPPNTPPSVSLSPTLQPTTTYLRQRESDRAGLSQLLSDEVTGVSRVAVMTRRQVHQQCTMSASMGISISSSSGSDQLDPLVPVSEEKGKIKRRKGNKVARFNTTTSSSSKVRADVSEARESRYKSSELRDWIQWMNQDLVLKTWSMALVGVVLIGTGFGLGSLWRTGSKCVCGSN